jgi:hypothetical protein
MKLGMRDQEATRGLPYDRVIVRDREGTRALPYELGLWGSIAIARGVSRHIQRIQRGERPSPRGIVGAMRIWWEVRLTAMSLRDREGIRAQDVVAPHGVAAR